MSTSPVIHLPEAFTAYIEQNYYGQVTEQSKLEVIVKDPDFLKNPLKHVALFSDHGILHGRDIADKITGVLHQINGVLIPYKTPSQLEFMLGYGAMLAYLHDIGMKNFSAFGRAMHPEFAAQLVFTSEFDPWVELLWRENAGGVAWRLMNLAVKGALQNPQRVMREMLSLSMAHSKSKVSIEVLNDLQVLQQTMQHRVSTELHYLYHQQQVAIAEKKLAQSQTTPERDRWCQQLDQAKVHLTQVEARTTHEQRQNPDIQKHYGESEQAAFSWLVSDLPEVQQLTVDVIDTVRALRCADALRQRGTAFTTSAGYEVVISQDTANAIYALRTGDRAQILLLEGKDPISAGEANMANSTLDREGNLRLAFTRGAFSSPEATQWAAYSAAVVAQDIQADVIESFRRWPCRSEGESPYENPQNLAKLESEMQLLVEGVDDNPEFADLVCHHLSKINPGLTPRIKAVTSLQYADLNQVERYMGGIQPPWDVAEKLHFLDQLVKTGQKVDAIDLEQAFTETRLITVKAGEVLIQQGTRVGFVYIPLQVGLKLMLPDNQTTALPLIPIGDVEIIRGAVASVNVVADQTVELLMIPKQIYFRHWYASYTVDEFTHLFAHGKTQPKLPTQRTTSPELAVQRLTRRRSRALPLAIHLMRLFPDTEHLDRFMSYLEMIELQPGEYLFHQGDRPTALYIVELGQINIAEPHIGHSRQTFNAGDWIGGGEFFSRAVYQHSARADKPSTLYRLSISALEQMQVEASQVFHIVTQTLLGQLADRLHQAQQEITTLVQERTEMLNRLMTSPSE